MTSPALDPHAQPAPTQQRRLLVALTALLAAGYSAQVLTPRLRTLLAPLGLSPAAITAALRLATTRPPAGTGTAVQLRVAVSNTRPGARPQAVARQVQAEPGMRARYLLASAERIDRTLKATPAPIVPAPGQGPADLLDRALGAEQRYLQQHLDAQRRRLAAAGMVQQAQAQHGLILGWRTQRDSKVTPDCAALDGSNFRADTQPAAGWPGALHGGTCRCYPGPPHATDRRVP